MISKSNKGLKLRARNYPTGTSELIPLEPTRIYVEIVRNVDIVLLARKYPAGTSELFPLGSNSDLGRNFTPRNFFPLACKVWIYVEVVQYVEFSPLV